MFIKKKKTNQRHELHIWEGLPKAVFYWHMVLVFSFVFTAGLIFLAGRLFLQIDGVELYSDKKEKEQSLLHEKKLQKILERYSFNKEESL